jgi:hypothetical protein
MWGLAKWKLRSQEQVGKDCVRSAVILAVCEVQVGSVTSLNILERR